MLTSTRRRALAVAAASGAALAAQLVAAPLAVAAVNPAQACVQLGDLELSRGACASSVAQSQTGDPLAVVPSGAAYIANCKDLEQTMFAVDGARPYPYAFYGAYTVENRAQCVQVLRSLHGGELSPPAP